MPDFRIEQVSVFYLYEGKNLIGTFSREEDAKSFMESMIAQDEILDGVAAE